MGPSPLVVCQGRVKPDLLRTLSFDNLSTSVPIELRFGSPIPSFFLSHFRTPFPGNGYQTLDIQFIKQNDDESMICHRAVDWGIP